MPMPKSFTQIAAGLVIAEKYKLVRQLGEGSMGVVWLAINLATAREVALKLIHRPDPELRRRLQREGRNSGALRHRNVIDLYDMGETEHGEPFLVMQLLVGETLADLLQRRRRLDAEVAASIGRDVARGISAVHALHIVHRDLKPANIFLHREPDVEEPVVKVLDFGVAKNLAVNDGVRTATGGAVGSPLYMSPEQVRADPNVDHRADIWALGVVLFEMLTGMRPFQGDARAVFMGILTGEIPKVSRYLRRVDPGLVELVARCMARHPDERIGSAAEVAELLDAYTVAGRAAGMAVGVGLGAGQRAVSELPARPSGVAPAGSLSGQSSGVAPAGSVSGQSSGVAPAGSLPGPLPSPAPAGVLPGQSSGVAPAGSLPGPLPSPVPAGSLSGPLPSPVPAGSLSGPLPSPVPAGSLSGQPPGPVPAGSLSGQPPGPVPAGSLPGRPVNAAPEPVWNAELTQKLEPEAMMGADAGTSVSPARGQDEPGRSRRPTTASPASGLEAGRGQGAQPSPWAARATPPPEPPEPRRRHRTNRFPGAAVALVAAFVVGLVGAVLVSLLRTPGGAEVSTEPEALPGPGSAGEVPVATTAETSPAPAAPAADPAPLASTAESPGSAPGSEGNVDAGAAGSSADTAPEAPASPSENQPASATTAASAATAAPVAAASVPAAVAPPLRPAVAAPPGGTPPAKTAAPSPPPRPQQPSKPRTRVDPCAGKTGFMRTNCLREHERKRDPYAP
ncbi:protein kinase [Sorangium sp. So ce1036]|uniref:serine/threonine-protein kinase n=1 Tax=Sorangium sp. So ce1036 TaxID=3133328 RepID=UPI003EFF1233